MRIQLAPASCFGRGAFFNDDGTPCCSHGHMSELLCQGLDELPRTWRDAYQRKAAELLNNPARRSFSVMLLNDNFLDPAQRRECLAYALTQHGVTVLDGPDTRLLRD